MRKRIAFLSFAAALVFCYSCSNDETVAVNTTPQDNEISFRALMTGMTRAADANLGANGFRVTAFPTGTAASAYFTNVDFTLSAGNYTSANKYYWPSASNLDFYAFSPIDAAVVGADKQIVPTSDGSTYNAASYNKFLVTPDETALSNAQVDLVYAKAKNWGKVSGNDGTNGVTINFRHAESKVVVQLKNSNSSLYFTVKDVKIGYLDAYGVFTYPAGTDIETAGQNTGFLLSTYWTGQPTTYTGVYQLANTASTSYNAAAATPVGNDLILVPQTLYENTVYSGTTAHNWADGTEGSPFNGAYIMVEYKVQNGNSSGAYIVGAADNTGEPSAPEYIKAIWPLKSIVWNPGYKYTYTVDLAGGGYYADNNDTNTDLDPVLGGSEIMFANVTVDAWSNSDVFIAKAGSTHTINVANKYASNPYIIYVTGLTAGSTIAAVGTNCFTASPTISDSGTVPASGIIQISGDLSANDDTQQTSTITITETGAGTSVTTINIVQAAPTPAP